MVVRPRELYDNVSPALAQIAAANDEDADWLETSVRMRLLAKECITQSIREDRIARAARSHVHRKRGDELEKLTDGSQVEIWREPDSKSESGWRGPAKMIKGMFQDGKAIVSRRGFPYLIPLRHSRPHCGFMHLFRVYVAGGLDNLILMLMALVEFVTPNCIRTFGTQWCSKSHRFVHTPSDVMEKPPDIFKLANLIV